MSICQGASYHFGNADLTVAGTYSDTTQTVLGCDSITTLTLTVEEILRDTINESICHGGSYHFGNADLTAAGTYSDTTQTLAGCDSIIVLNLTVEDYLRDTINVSICQGATYHFGNADLTVAGTYSDTTQTALGCDSITVLNLTVEDYLRVEIEQAICQGASFLFGGETLTEAGVYHDTVQTALGVTAAATTSATPT